PVSWPLSRRSARAEPPPRQIGRPIRETAGPGLPEEVKGLITRQLRAGFVFLSMILWEPPEGFWELPPYFLPNHRVLMRHARDAGLGVLSYEEQAENWRVAMARGRASVAPRGGRLPRHPRAGHRRRGRGRRHQPRGHHPGVLNLAAWLVSGRGAAGVAFRS